MITSSIPSHVLKGTFKISSDVKATSAVQMNVSLNTALIEKNVSTASRDDASNVEDSVTISSNGGADYQKTYHRGGLEFCHEHLFDIDV
jgi:hypothetical protein